MITPAYIRTIAEYNAEMNRRLYGAASRLSDAERRLLRDAWLAERSHLVYQRRRLTEEVHAPLRLLVTHFFSHQTHHRGQVHAVLTAAGQEAGNTELFLLVPEIVG